MIKIFVLIFLSASLASCVDVNSASQMQMIWNYLQLRPADTFTTTNTSTSLANLAATYYGNATLASLIKESNPTLPDIVKVKNTRITLPPILKCIEKTSLTCILSSFMLKGTDMPIALEPTLYDKTHDFNKGRLLVSTGDEYDLGWQEGYHLVEQFPDLKPTSVNIKTINQMGEALQLKSAGTVQKIESNSIYWSTTKVVSPRIAFQVLSYKTFAGVEYTVNVTISTTPVSTFPFFGPGQDDTISATFLDSTGNQVASINDIKSTDGFQSSLLLDLQVNITLGLESISGATTATIILAEYYSSTLSGRVNLITNIFPAQNTQIAVQLLKNPLQNFNLATRAIDGNNRGATFAWRVALTGERENFFRIINFVNGEAITANHNSMSISTSEASLSDIDQVWTLIPTTSSTDIGSEFKLFYVKNKNLCWSLDIATESTLDANIPLHFPLRLKPCNTQDLTQKFAFYYTVSGKLDWMN